MITEELKNLKREFLRIKNMGYVKSIKNGSTGIGKTFENLLEKKDGISSIYQEILLKVKKDYTDSYTTLFLATPEGDDEYQVKRLKDKYGYTIKNGSKIKVLMCSVQANCSTFVANKYLFKLEVDREKERIVLNIASQNFTIIDQKSYWSFDLIKSRLERKMPYLALIKAWTKVIDREEYYKYYDIDFYKLKTFEDFLSLIERGTIRITFKVGVYKSGPFRNQINDKGTSFEIQEIDFGKLFDKVEVQLGD